MNYRHFSTRQAVRWILPAILLITGCTGQLPLAQAPTETPQPTATFTQAPTDTATPTLEPSPTLTATITLTPTETLTPTITLTPTETSTPTVAPSPTRDYPSVTVTQAQAFCRYGPGKAYLYYHPLYEGMKMNAEGRNSTGTWLWVKPETLGAHCWSAASNFQITGDVKTLPVVTTTLPHSVLYGPPTSVTATRDGNMVTISWPAVWMTEDDNRGYMIEAYVCQNGAFIFYPVATMDTSITIQDDQTGCSGTSSGKLYTVEKHGYTDPINISWPK